MGLGRTPPLSPVTGGCKPTKHTCTSISEHSNPAEAHRGKQFLRCRCSEPCLACLFAPQSCCSFLRSGEAGLPPPPPPPNWQGIYKAEAAVDEGTLLTTIDDSRQKTDLDSSSVDQTHTGNTTGHPNDINSVTKMCGTSLVSTALVARPGGLNSRHLGLSRSHVQADQLPQSTGACNEWRRKACKWCRTKL